MATSRSMIRTAISVDTSLAQPDVHRACKADVAPAWIDHVGGGDGACIEASLLGRAAEGGDRVAVLYRSAGESTIPWLRLVYRSIGLNLESCHPPVCDILHIFTRFAQ